MFGRQEESSSETARRPPSGKRRHVRIAAQVPPPKSAGSSARASPAFGERATASSAAAGIRRNLRDAANLVHIKVLNVDSRAHDFPSKYNRTNRFVDVDFNTLDLNFNLQT